MLVQIVCLIVLLISFKPADSAEPVRIGVLAFRPKPQTLNQWQPLTVVLKRAMPERDFVISALTYPELNAAVANRQLDFVFTNPGHFVLLKIRGGLSAPLATLAVDVNGQRANAFGGIIFSRSEQKSINTLGDIKGKIVAVPDTESLGGYQMQAYELHRAGVRLTQDAQLLVTGMPHDNVIKAVLDGRADVGFVRSGVLESAALEGKLDIKRLKLLNLQQQPALNQIVSTRLYPEWPFTALSNTDEKLARHVAAALFTLEENSAMVRTMGIHGFSIPADYSPVEELLREMRFPPFDKAPSFTITDVWNRYRWQTVSTLVISLIISMLGFRLLLTKRRLEAEQKLVLLQSQKVQESENRLRTILETEPECVKIINSEGTLIHMNPAGLAMLHADSPAQVVGHSVLDIVVPEYRADYALLHQRVLAGESMKMEFEVQGFNGERRLLETHAVPMIDQGTVVHLAVSRDVTERRQAEAEREAALARVKKLEGIIPICMYCKKIRDDQNSWNQLESYITNNSEAVFSHGICPQCLDNHYSENK